MIVANKTEESKEIESTILAKVDQRGSCRLDDLVQEIPGYTWSQLFVAVDRLSKDGLLRLKHPGRFDYVVESKRRRTY